MKRIDFPTLLPALLAASLLAMPARSAEPVGDTQVYKKVDGRDLKLHVVKPAGWKASDLRPAIVYFHGGGWTGGTPTQFNDHATYFATRGIVCVQVQYRLLTKADKGPPVKCVHDAKSAMRWVRSRAAELGVDPKRIAAAGGSAGGHLAAFVGMVEGVDDPADDVKVSARADALLLFNPVYDNGPDAGWNTARVGEAYKQYSPAHNITPDDPPAVVFLGSKDNLIPVTVAQRFRDNMKKAGIRSDLHVYEGQPHGFFNRDPFKTLTLIESDKFLADLGWLKGEPTARPPAGTTEKSR